MCALTKRSDTSMDCSERNKCAHPLLKSSSVLHRSSNAYGSDDLAGTNHITLERKFNSANNIDLHDSQDEKDSLIGSVVSNVQSLPQKLLSKGSGNLPISQYQSSNSTGVHQIRIEEVVPSNSSLLENSERNWKLSLQLFTSKLHGKPDNKLPRSVRRYYKAQDELISFFEDLQLEVEDDMESTEEMQRLRKKTRILSQISFFCNLLLLISKTIAAGLSGSLSIISAVVDSAVDLVSGFLVWWSGKAMKKRDPYEYPQGRTRLEPVAIVVISVVMTLASVQIVREAVEQIIQYATSNLSPPTVDIATICLCSCTIVVKLVLFIVCRRVKTDSCQVLAQDHRNDVLSNSVALASGFISSRYWSYADPLGALLISFYIIANWALTGWEQIKMLTGHTARPDFLKRITWIALNHHPKVLLIDTVRVYHFGSNFIVELDIVLPEDMSLRESHDIGESLQVKIERLHQVERAFVHLDYECDHDPRSEHKQV